MAKKLTRQRKYHLSMLEKGLAYIHIYVPIGKVDDYKRQAKEDVDKLLNEEKVDG